MSILSRLFSGKAKDAIGGSDGGPGAEAEDYNGFRITAQPIRDAGGFRVAALIEKDVGGVSRSHRMIRADTCSALEVAEQTSLRKAKVLIDQMGEGLFG